MKRLAIVVAFVAALGIVLVASGAFYVVDETQQVVLTQFGKPVGEPIATPGLKIKLPFLQVANSFDRRFLEWDGDPNQLPTRDKRFIYVDSYARWRIDDPLVFFQRLRDERGAQSRLDDILDGETRNTIAKHDLIEVVRSSNRDFAAVEQVGEEVPGDATGERVEIGRAALEAEVLANASRRTADLGIEILDFRFKRLDYVEEVRQKVYERMISERERIAAQYRSEGEGEAARIRGEKERELREISSDAYRQAQEIKGRADAEAADVYAAAYSRDPEFYRFLKTMDTLRTVIDGKTVVLLGTDGEMMRFLESSK